KVVPHLKWLTLAREDVAMMQHMQHDIFGNLRELTLAYYPNENHPGGISDACNILVTSGEFQTNFGSAARFLATATRQFSFAPASSANIQQFPSNPATD
ncbi:hypothetical protein NL676_030629, partial [Syzygium grande]